MRSGVNPCFSSAQQRSTGFATDHLALNVLDEGVDAGLVAREGVTEILHTLRQWAIRFL